MRYLPCVSTKASTSPTRLVKALVISVPEAEQPAGASKAVDDDPWAGLADDTITPPIDRSWLLQIVSCSGELCRDIDVMVANVDGFGHRFVPRIAVDGIDEETGEPLVDEETRKAVRAERIFLDNFFAMAAMGENGKHESFVGLRKRTRKGLEATGDGFWEVIRGPTGKLLTFRCLRPHHVRLGVADAADTRIERKYLTQTLEGTWEWETRTEWHRFRRYAQCVVDSRAQETRWFKCFGDPRVLDVETGLWIPHESEVGPEHAGPTVEDFDGQGNPMPWGRRANEIVHFAIHDPASPYGCARWLGETKAVLGVTAAEEINYSTFDNNNVPSMLVTVSNGSLTDASIARIEEFVKTHIRGQRNYSQFLILEGELAEDAIVGESGLPKIDVRQLQDSQIRDVLFGDYTKSRNDNIRSAFRFSSIFTGDATEVNESSAEQLRRLADEQVFALERDDFDAFVNDAIFPELGIRWHRFVSRTPNVTDNQELVRILASAERTGGVTPRLSRLMIEDVFPAAGDLPSIKGVDPDVPFSLQMAEAVKNMALPGEPGQQIAPVVPPIVPKGPKAEDSALSKSFRDELVHDLLGFGDRLATEIGRAARDE